MEVVASLSQGRTAAAQCGLFTYKSVPVIFEPPCTLIYVRFEVFTLGNFQPAVLGDVTPCHLLGLVAFHKP